MGINILANVAVSYLQSLLLYNVLVLFEKDIHCDFYHPTLDSINMATVKLWPDELVVF